MAIYDSRAIQEILPHRYPFLLVDKIVERMIEDNVGFMLVDTDLNR